MFQCLLPWSFWLNRDSTWKALQCCNPILGKFQRLSLPSLECIWREGWRPGCQLMRPASSHSPWECICLPLVPCTWFTLGRGPFLGRICPKDSPEVAWVLHELGYPLLELWPWSHLSLLFITALRYRGPRPPRPYGDLWVCRPLHGLPYLWVSGGDINDASTWSRPHLATPTSGDAQNGQPIDFLPWAPWRVAPRVWLWLWL